MRIQLNPKSHVNVFSLSLADLITLIVFSILALEKQEFDWSSWWDTNVVNYHFTTSVLDLVLSSLLRNLVVIILGLDCFAPCCSRAACCVTPLYPPEVIGAQMDLQLQSVASGPGKRSLFSPLLQIYTPWLSKFARIFGFIVALVILFVNLPYLLAKVLFYNNTPFNVFYLILIIIAVVACVLEAPLLLKLWFMKRRIHHHRRHLRRAQHRRPKHLSSRGRSERRDPESQSLLGSGNGPDDDGFYSQDDDTTSTTQILRDSTGRAVSAIYYDFYEYDHSSESDASDGTHPPYSPGPLIPPGKRSQDPAFATSPTTTDASFRTPRGSFISAKEALSSDGEEDEEVWGTPTRSFPGSPNSSYNSLRSSRGGRSSDPKASSDSSAAHLSASVERITSVPLSLSSKLREDPAAAATGGRLSQFVELLKGAVGAGDMDALGLQMPSWSLEGDSALEREVVMECPQFFSAIGEATTPLDRMIAVTCFFLTGLHPHAATKKKPFNPILGEQFHCHWPETNVRYFSEQVSHHPPVATFHCMDESKGVEYSGTHQSVSSFTGSAFKVSMQGPNTIVVRRPLTHRPSKKSAKRSGSLSSTGSAEDSVAEYYSFKLPDYYLRGILVGNVYVDFSGEVVISCPQTGCTATVKFLEKPLVGGEFRRVEGQILDEMMNVRYILAGRWDTVVEMTNRVTGETEVLFEVSKEEKIKPMVRPVKEQGLMESQRVWYACARAIKDENWGLADRAKKAVEDLQRRYQQDIEKRTVSQYRPVFFDPVPDDPTRFTFVGEAEAKRRRAWLDHYTQTSAV